MTGDPQTSPPTQDAAPAAVSSEPLAIETRPLPPAVIEASGAQSVAAAPPRSLVPHKAGKLTFADHTGFQLNALQAALGGAAAGLISYGLVGMFQLAELLPTFFILTTTGALAALGARVGGWRSALKAGGLGLLGGILQGLALPEWPLLGALLLGGAAAPVLAKGADSGRMLFTAGATAVMALAGFYVASVFQTHGVLAPLLPSPLAAAAAGGAAGLFLGLGAAPRHLIPAEEPVEAAYARALVGPGGELQDILHRALEIYRVIRGDLEARRGGPTEAKLAIRVSDLALRILAISEKCRGIERDLGATPAHDLEQRIAALSAKAEATTDPAAKETFQAAIRSFEQQRAAVEAIGRGLERVLARLHANVALLEKVRFSLVHARSADAERIGGEASPLAETIEELSRELDATSQAVGEVYGKKA